MKEEIIVDCIRRDYDTHDIFLSGGGAVYSDN